MYFWGRPGGFNSLKKSFSVCFWVFGYVSIIGAASDSCFASLHNFSVSFYRICLCKSQSLDNSSLLRCTKAKSLQAKEMMNHLLSLQFVANCGLSVRLLLLCIWRHWHVVFEKSSRKVEEVEPQWSSHLQKQPALINLIWAQFISCQKLLTARTKLLSFLHAPTFTHMQYCGCSPCVLRNDVYVFLHRCSLVLWLMLTWLYDFNVDNVQLIPGMRSR